MPRILYLMSEGRRSFLKRRFWVDLQWLWDGRGPGCYRGVPVLVLRKVKKVD